MDLVHAVGHAPNLAFSMTWEVTWALILGFALSGGVQAVISKAEMSRLLPDDSPRSLTIATGLGAASSSCSYAAVAVARSIVRKGGDFTAAMAFEIASTNLVIELGIILAVLIGWQFTLAEFVGGPLMIVVVALLFRRLLRPSLLRQAREQADRGVRGRMEGHAEMDMAVTEGSIWSRLTSSKGFTALSHYFVMDWASVWTDVTPACSSPARSAPGSRPASGRASSSSTIRCSPSSGARWWAQLWPWSASSAPSGTFRSPPCSGTGASASAES
jgi:uncharacterized membrane protein YraQ (UPF0718 family)